MIDPAYPVPFHFDRRSAPSLYLLTNIGPEQLSGLSFTLLGSGIMRATAPLLIDPGQQVQLRIAGPNLPRRAVLVVRWFRPNSDEYLWRVSF
jgi:hypothetical protein